MSRKRSFSRFSQNETLEREALGDTGKSLAKILKFIYSKSQIVVIISNPLLSNKEFFLFLKIQ